VLVGMVAGLATFLVACLSLGVLYWLAQGALQDTIRAQLRTRSLAASRLVDIPLHEQLVDHAQMGSPAHLRALQPLVAFRRLFPDIICIYTVRLRNGQETVVLNTGPDPALAAHRPAPFPPIGAPYQAQSAAENRQTLAALARGQPYVSPEIFSDPAGAFLTGFAPLRDATGRTIGFVGVDLTAEDYYAKMRPLAWALAAGGLADGVLSAAVGEGVMLFLRFRRRARADAIAQETLVARLLESLTDGIIVLRPVPDAASGEPGDFAILLANLAAERLTGQHLAGVCAKSLRNTLPVLAQADLTEAYRRVARTAQPFYGECRYSARGLDRWLRLAVARVDDRLVLTLSDISASKRHERELEAARAQAVSANRAKGQFLATLSHEVRTPLNAIVGMTHLLRDTNLTDEQGEYLHALEESGGALLTVINDLLDFSKIESGHLLLAPDSFSVADFLHRLREVFAPLARTKGLEFNLEISANAPVTLRSDPSRLRQVLMNLLANAVKFTDHGSVTLRAEMAPDVRWLVLRVADTGIGIAPHLHRSIFEPFTQGDSSTTRRYGGTGLGLAIATHLMERMGGRIEVESEPGRGSAFSVWVPLTPPVEPTAE
jgi:signal transduction histidine kinase